MTTYSLPRSSDLGEHLERRSVGSTPTTRFRTPDHTVNSTGNPTPQRSTKFWATAAAAAIVVGGVAAVASVSGSDPEPEQVGAVDQAAVAGWAEANGRTGSSPTSLTLTPPQPSATQMIQQSIDEALASRPVTAPQPSATQLIQQSIDEALASRPGTTDRDLGPSPSATQLIQQSIDEALASRPVTAPQRSDTQLIQQAIDEARADTGSFVPVPVPSTADGAERRASASVPSVPVPSTADGAERRASNGDDESASGAQRRAGNGYV